MSVFVIGKVPDAARATIEAAVARTGVPLRFFDSPARLMAEDSSAHARPYCFFAHTPELGRFIDWARDQGHLYDVPIIALALMPTETAFREVLDLGADDIVLLHDPAGITRRVASLALVRRVETRPLTTRHALVCDANEKRRRLTGRALRHAGYELSFAHALDEAARVLNKKPTQVAILAEDAAQGSTSTAIQALRVASSSPDVPFVILGAGSSDPRGSISRIPGVVHLPEGSPTGHLLFQVNELMNPHAREMRTSPRLLHTTLCAFRKAGDMNPSYGLTYNVSREGMFVRTLDPIPRGGTAWLELRPGAGEGAVHLRGHVAWVWCSDPTIPSPTPPGFGVRLDLASSPAEDAARYVAAYEQLVSEDRGQRSISPDAASSEAPQRTVAQSV